MKLFSKAVGVLCSIGALVCSIGAITPMPVSAAVVYGDVDGDGSVSTTDSLALMKYLEGMTSVGSINLKNADVDKNTLVDINDQKILSSYLMGSIAALPYSQSGTTFNYSSYTVPADAARSYVKYDCSSKRTESYTLSLPSSRSSTSNISTHSLPDDRVLDASANAQCIVYLTYKCSNGSTYRGTGFIVGDGVIATSAHCIYDGNAFNTNYTIRVYNAAGTSVVATYSAKELHVSSDFYNAYTGSYTSWVSQYDYGLIYVEDDLSQYGTMALGLSTDNFERTAQNVSISGFPAIVNGSSTTKRYYASGKILTTSTDYVLNSEAYASPGDSGGPIYMEYTLSGNKFRSAIGIFGYMNNANNPDHTGGVRMTQPVLRFFLDNPNIG